MKYTDFEVRVPFDGFNKVVCCEQVKWTISTTVPVVKFTNKIKDLYKRYGTKARITLNTNRDDVG